MRNHRLKGTRILLLEDAQAVVATGSGLEAATIADRDESDVFLTDLDLPDIPGDMVIRHVLESAKHRPRVVAVTGHDEPFLTRAREAGADVVLTKPVDWRSLVDCLVPSRKRTHAA